jgi:L-threonylcarbamoyladenylate synthase
MHMPNPWTISATAPDPALLEQACAALRAGGLVIVPTETVYGVAADLTLPGAREKLYAAKGRDANKPVARLTDGAASAETDDATFSATARRLVNRWWPGPLTLVLPTRDTWTGYRVPNHPVALALAQRYGRPIGLTSANLSGEPDTVTAAAAAKALGPHAAWILDAGPAEGGTPSTVVKVDGPEVILLREGAVPFEEIQKEAAL